MDRGGWAIPLTQHPDPQLEATADEAIDIVCAAQLENGYLDTYYIINDQDQIFTNLKDNHELYCFGHLTEGAVAYYQATGKDKLLKAAERMRIIFPPASARRKGRRRAIPDMRSRRWRWCVCTSRPGRKNIWS